MFQRMLKALAAILVAVLFFDLFLRILGVRRDRARRKHYDVDAEGVSGRQVDLAELPAGMRLTTQGLRLPGRAVRVKKAS